jgi:hypothetical protein
VIDDTRLAALLRSAMPPVRASAPSRDLWPLVARGGRQHASWSWLDLALAAGVAASVIAWPDMLILLAYHF